MRCGRWAGGRAAATSRGRRRSLKPLFGALEGALEALGAEGLEQVIHGVGVEGAHGVLVVGGGEDHGGRARAGRIDQLQHLEAIEFGHLDVEKEQVWGKIGHGFDGFEAVGAFGGDFDFRMGGEQFAQEAAGQLLVIHDHGAKGSGGHLWTKCRTTHWHEACEDRGIRPHGRKNYAIGRFVMKTTVSMLALGLAIGVAMAQDPPAPPPANQNAAPPAANMPAPTGNAPTEMKTSTYKGTLVDLACVGDAWVTTAEPNAANRTAGECKVTPESTQLGLRLEDGHTLRFDMVGTERARAGAEDQQTLEQRPGRRQADSRHGGGGDQRQQDDRVVNSLGGHWEIDRVVRRSGGLHPATLGFDPASATMEPWGWRCWRRSGWRGRRPRFRTTSRRSCTGNAWPATGRAGWLRSVC